MKKATAFYRKGIKLSLDLLYNSIATKNQQKSKAIIKLLKK